MASRCGKLVCMYVRFHVDSLSLSSLSLSLSPSHAVAGSSCLRHDGTSFSPLFFSLFFFLFPINKRITHKQKKNLIIKKGASPEAATRWHHGTSLFPLLFLIFFSFSPINKRITHKQKKSRKQKKRCWS